MDACCCSNEKKTTDILVIINPSTFLKRAKFKQRNMTLIWCCQLHVSADAVMAASRLDPNADILRHKTTWGENTEKPARRRKHPGESKMWFEAICGYLSHFLLLQAHFEEKNNYKKTDPINQYYSRQTYWQISLNTCFL